MSLSTCHTPVLLAFLFAVFGPTVHGSASAEVTFKEGANMTLPCEFPTTAANVLYKVFWIKNGTKILTKRFHPQRITIHVTDSQKDFRIAGQASLVVYNGDRHQNGVYACHAWYMDGTKVRKDITLHVEAHPILYSSSPAVQNITQGYPRRRKLILSCAASAYPEAKISWTKTGGLQSISGREYAKSYDLTIQDPGKADSGTYTCSATNKMGTDAKNFTVTVFELPQIIGKRKFHANAGEDAKVKCTARGNPEPTFTWSWKIFNNSTMTMKDGENNGLLSVKTTHNSDLSESVLEIKDMTEADWKWYKCEVKSRLGKDSASIMLTGKTKPESPRIVSVQCQSHKAVVKWMVGEDGGSPLTSLTLEYKAGMNGENENINWTRISITPDLMEYTIENLEPDTFYRFRILATNEIGDSEPSATVTQNTKKTEPTTTLANEKSSGDFLSNHMTGLIAGVAGGFLAFMIGMLGIFCFIRKVIKKNASAANSPNNSRPTSHQEPTEMTTFLPQGGQPASSDIQQDTTVNPLCNGRWEFPRERLDLQTVLGSGAFGIVMKAQAAGIKGCVGSLTVAVKIVKDSDNETAKKDLLAELELLKLIEPHPNVIGLLGCCTRGAPESSLMLIVEYCHYGDLQSYLRHCRGVEDKCYMDMYHAPVQKMDSRDLLSFAIQVARGMSHLAGMKVVHRDLAARNILIDEQKVIKVSDFGFARDIYVEDHYTRKTQGGRFPIKWMALESLLDGVSTSKSDVWSFGVLLWEIVTLGASPYPGMNSQEVINFLQDGFRMDKPKHCSQDLYVCMLDCWKAHPQHRPTFPDLARQLSKMLSDEQEYIDMRMYENHLYINFDKTTGTNPPSGHSHPSSTAM